MENFLVLGTKEFIRTCWVLMCKYGGRSHYIPWNKFDCSWKNRAKFNQAKKVFVIKKMILWFILILKIGTQYIVTDLLYKHNMLCQFFKKIVNQQNHRWQIVFVAFFVDKKWWFEEPLGWRIKYFFHSLPFRRRRYTVKLFECNQN